MEKFIKYVKVVRRRGPRNIVVRLNKDKLNILCLMKKEPIEEFIYNKSPNGSKILEIMYYEAIECVRSDFEEDIYESLEFKLILQESTIDLDSDKIILQYKCFDCK